jgi:hypothetical protein
MMQINKLEISFTFNPQFRLYVDVNCCICELRSFWILKCDTGGGFVRIRQTAIKPLFIASGQSFTERR